jgi:hypothetical protein
MNQKLWGYMGRLLRVDLTSGAHWDEPLEPLWRRTISAARDSARNIYTARFRLVSSGTIPATLLSWLPGP